MGALAATSLLGALARLESPEADLSIWIWLALWAAPAGALAGAWSKGFWILLPWLSALASAVFFRSVSADPWGGTLAISGLYWLGASLHGSSGAAAWSRAAGLLFLVGVLTAMPSLGGALARPLEPATTAFWLDLSPLVWVMESAGFDWMRHPSIYEIAGAADLGPDLRVAYSGTGVPLVATLLGVVLVGIRRGWTPRRGNPAGACD